MSQQPPPGTGDRMGSAIVAMAQLDEDVVDQVTGLGAVLVVTATRIAVIREGAHFRPRSGVRAWEHSQLRDVHLESPRNGSGRVVLRIGPFPWQIVSLFIDEREWTAVERVARQIRSFAAVARRAQRTTDAADRATSVAGRPKPNE
jgi:hypothetical protein